MVNKPIQIYKYKFQDYHYKGISVLQEYFGKKISSSKGLEKRWLKNTLDTLKKIKKQSLYTTKQKLFLNDLRSEYLLSKNPSKKWHLKKFRYV